MGRATGVVPPRRGPPPTAAVLLPAAVTICLQAWFALATPSLIARVYALNLGTALVIAAALPAGRALWRGSGCDRSLLALVAAFVAFTTLRTLALGQTAAGAGSAEFLTTPVWVATQLMLLVFMLAIALAALAGALGDDLREARRERDTDPLTGLVSRRRFEELAAAAVARRDGGDVSLIFCDVDHFKTINDVHGHEAGDRVLQSCAGVLAGRDRVAADEPVVA